MSINRSFKADESERDALISNLRKQVFELEQSEKNYNNLNNKYRTLQNDFTLACEDKLRMEYEYKQRLDMANKQILELKTDIEAVQQTLEERVSLNKKLYQDNSSLHRLSEDRLAENNELKAQLNESRNNHESCANQKSQVEKILGQTQDELNNQKLFNDKLVEDNEKLNRLVDDQEFAIKNLDSEKRKLMNRSDEQLFEIKSLNGKLKAKEESLGQANRKIEDCNKTISLLDNKCAELDAILEKTKIELSGSRKDHNKEKNTRLDHERTIEKLDLQNREKEKDIRNAITDIENLKLLSAKQNEEKNRQSEEIERLKQHVLVLTEQNQKYIEEIEGYLDQDEKIRNQLNSRRELSNSLLRGNKVNLEKSLNNLDEFLNKSGARITSPTRYGSKK